ncbi:hypothetical protein [Marinospirillum sp.]|uniref:hypothetical protein n=1 Tax=Marinospirillum sp. TaxID=2183934 RepID=UPI0028705641|nr:hypothetical protein [Marinospirillum sp.]MDR9469420.1 hypothetical protein [Marinospirillum sp.]
MRQGLYPILLCVLLVLSGCSAQTNTPQDELTLTGEPLDADLIPASQENDKDESEDKEDTEEEELKLLQANLEELSPEELREEMRLLNDLQAGLEITLAACEDEPHCVTAFTEQEVERLQKEIQLIIGRLESGEAEYDELLGQLQKTQTGYSQLQNNFTQVAARIDRDELEGNWADQFVFDDFDLGPDVPYPNEHITLNLFEDAHKPLPIE